MNILALVLLIMLLIGNGNGNGNGRSDTELVNELFEEYFKWKLDKNPMAATSLGFHEYDSKLNEVSLKSIWKMKLELEEFESITNNLLNTVNESSSYFRYLKIMKYELDTALEGFKYKGYYFTPIHFMDNIAQYIPMEKLKWNTEKDYLINLERLRKIPRFIDQVRNMTMQAQKHGYGYANESIADALIAFDSLLNITDVEDSKFYSYFKNMTSDINNSSEIQNEAKDVILNKINPEYEKLASYLKNDYLVRPNLSISSLQYGESRYEAIIKWYLSSEEITAEEIHQIGLKEVAKIHQEFKNDIRNILKLNLTFSEVFEKYKTDPKYQVTDSNKIKKFVTSIIEDQINPKLKDYFHDTDLSNDTYNLNIVFDSDSPLQGFYLHATVDGTRNGSYNIGIKEPSLSRWEEYMALSLHEGNPGHHLQFTHTLNNKLIPKFMRYYMGNLHQAPFGTPTYNSYFEGWALYSEYLGREMGLYENDTSQLVGFYNFNLLRACRLVVDTGLHSKGWSSQKAEDYLIENAGMVQSSARIEVNRYITWPGQSLTYKMGERIIKKLRKKYESSNPDHNIKDFHSAILACYGPLNMLSECVHTKLAFKN